MSGRKLGGGRILGSGKSLAPPAPLARQRTSDIISPAESTVSLSSRDSTASPLATSPLPDNNQDLSSVVSLQNGGLPTVTAASTKLLCPICNEEMVGFSQASFRMVANEPQMTLLQLNRYA
jgi:rabenosyn-5